MVLVIMYGMYMHMTMVLIRVTMSPGSIMLLIPFITTPVMLTVVIIQILPYRLTHWIHGILMAFQVMPPASRDVDCCTIMTGYSPGVPNEKGSSAEFIRSAFLH